MSSSGLPTTTAPTSAAAAYTGAATLTSQQMPPGLQPPARAISAHATLAADVPPTLSPTEVATAIRDLTWAVSDLRTAIRDRATYGPVRLPWQPPHQAASGPIAGPRQPTLLLDQRLSTVPQPQWISKLFGSAITAPVITFQHGMPYDGTATT